MRKIEILTRDEQQAFDDPPLFTVSEQKIYFVLPENVDTWAKAIVMPSYLVGFILLWGYAKSHCKFFNPKRFHPSDIKYVCDCLKINQILLILQLIIKGLTVIINNSSENSCKLGFLMKLYLLSLEKQFKIKLLGINHPSKSYMKLRNYALKNELKSLAIIDLLQLFHLN